MLSRRTLLALVPLALFSLGGSCTGEADFTITKRYSVNSTAGVPYTLEQPVDLESEAGGAWKHRNHIKSLDLVGLDATLLTRTDGGAETHGSGSIILARAGFADVTVGTWPGTTPIPVATPHSIAVTLGDAGVALVQDALRGDGMFTVKLAGQTDANVTGTVQVSLHLKMTYKVKR